METCKRGCPTEDGWYVLKTAIYTSDVVRERVNGSFVALHDGNVIAHRKHEPLVVPELKELPKVESVSCVIRNRVSGDICHALRFSMGFVYSQGGATKSITCFTDAWKELTRAECEAAGYAYPKECEASQ